MVRLLFALFLVCGASWSVMAQDAVSPAPATENTGKDAVSATDVKDQDANAVKADEGTTSSTTVPVEGDVPAAPTK